MCVGHPSFPALWVLVGSKKYFLSLTLAIVICLVLVSQLSVQKHLSTFFQPFTPLHQYTFFSILFSADHFLSSHDLNVYFRVDTDRRK